MITNFFDALAQSRLLPALRGLQPTEAAAIGTALCSQGIVALEVPIRTRDPHMSRVEPSAIESIRVLIREIGDRAIVVAGTVTQQTDLKLLQDIGVRVCLSLVVQPQLIEAATTAGFLFIPGVDTASEAIIAASAGAAALKIFPATVREPDGSCNVRVSPGYIAYLSRFLSLPIVPAGNMFHERVVQEYLECGAAAINVGAQLYEPGISVDSLLSRSTLLIDWINRRSSS